MTAPNLRKETKAEVNRRADARDGFNASQQRQKEIINTRRLLRNHNSRNNAGWGGFNGNRCTSVNLLGVDFLSSLQTPPPSDFPSSHLLFSNQCGFAQLLGPWYFSLGILFLFHCGELRVSTHANSLRIQRRRCQDCKPSIGRLKRPPSPRCRVPTTVSGGNRFRMDLDNWCLGPIEVIDSVTLCACSRLPLRFV